MALIMKDAVFTENLSDVTPVEMFIGASTI